MIWMCNVQRTQTKTATIPVRPMPRQITPEPVRRQRKVRYSGADDEADEDGQPYSNGD